MQTTELNTAAAQIETQAQAAEQTSQLVELNVLELALVGGGSGAVSFY